MHLFAQIQASARAVRYPHTIPSTPSLVKTSYPSQGCAIDAVQSAARSSVSQCTPYQISCRRHRNAPGFHKQGNTSVMDANLPCWRSGCTPEPAGRRLPMLPALRPCARACAAWSPHPPAQGMHAAVLLRTVSSPSDIRGFGYPSSHYLWRLCCPPCQASAGGIWVAGYFLNDCQGDGCGEGYAESRLEFMATLA